jgi:alanine racemase
MVTAEHAGAILTIDLGAIAANYRLLSAQAGKAECAAVVKSDAYGLGLEPVARALAAAGCRQFFVSLIGEGIELRRILDDTAASDGDGAAIYVLNGLEAGAEAAFAEAALIPVLNTLAEIDAWAAFAAAGDTGRTGAINIDTGMARLGLTPADVDVLAADPARLDGIGIALVMSHLACAYDRDNSLNRTQREAFEAARARLPTAKASLANSSAIFLGTDYHFDLARPGASIFGIAPHARTPNPMAQVIHLKGKILQVRVVDSGMTVGYGATHRATRQSRIATVAVGYGDGYLRALSNRANGFIGGIKVPLVGRVSMDLITFDVSDVPETACRAGDYIDLICEHHHTDQLAAEGGTIGYEILTSLGRRYHRQYVCAPD